MSLITNSQYLNGSPASTAIQGGEQAPVTDTNGRSGWLFVKALTGTAKFNYFFYGEGSQAITLGEIKNIYANISNDNYLGGVTNPFIIVYTKPTGVGDAGAWYHSKITYKIPSSWNVQSGEIITIRTNLMTTNFGYRTCWLSDKTVDGDAALDEEILYMTIHSDSGAPAATQILVSEVGFSTIHGLQPLHRNIKYIST